MNEFQLNYQFNLEESEVDYEKGTLKGVMTRFNQETQDMRKLVLMPGCFDEFLATNKKIVMLKNHNSDMQIGKWTDMVADQEKLTGIGRLSLKIKEARDVMALVEDDALEALSIGFGVEDYSERNVEYEEDTDRVLLHRGYLTECSTVARPAMAGSKITEYFSENADNKEIRIVLKTLGLTRSQINAVLKIRESDPVSEEQEQMKLFYETMLKEFKN